MPALRRLRRLRQDRDDLVRPGDAAAAMQRAESETLAADLFIVVGSSLVVYPAAGFPGAGQAQRRALVIVNREPTGLDGIADLVLHRAIGETLGAAIGVA